LSLKSSGWQKLQKAVATILLIWGTILLVGAGYGQQDIYQPLPTTNVTVVGGEGKPKLSGEMPFEEVASITAYEMKKAEAMNNDKSMILFFHTDTCPVCKRLRETTFKDPKVQQILKEKYIALSVNMSDKSDQQIEKLKKMFGVFGPPGFVFIGPDGKEIKDAMFYGYQAAPEFYDTLDMIAE